MVMRTIGSLFCLGIAVMVQADPITLQQAEEQALKHNLVILAQRYDIDAADADVVTAHLFPNNPNISVSGDITPDVVVGRRTRKIITPHSRSLSNLVGKNRRVARRGK